MEHANLKLFRVGRLVPEVGWAIGNRPTGKAAPGAKGCGGRSLDKLLFLQPEDKIVGPRMGLGEGRLVVQADAMAALLVDVEIERDAVSLQRGRELEAVLDFDRGIFG